MTGHVRNLTTAPRSSQEYLRIVNEERKAQMRLMRQHRKDLNPKRGQGWMMAAAFCSIFYATAAYVGYVLIHWVFQ